MHFNFPSLLNQIRYAVDDAPFIRLNSLSYCFGYEFTVAGCQSAGNHCVVRAILGVGGAGEADAVFAGNTGVAPAVWQSVDKQRDRACYPTHLLSAMFEGHGLGTRRNSRQRIIATAGNLIFDGGPV